MDIHPPSKFKEPCFIFSIIIHLTKNLQCCKVWDPLLGDIRYCWITKRCENQANRNNCSVFRVLWCSVFLEVKGFMVYWTTHTTSVMSEEFLRLFRRSVNAVCARRLVTHPCPTLCDPTDRSPPGSFVREDSLGENTGVGCHAFLQGVFPTRDWTQVSGIAGGFFPSWATREAHWIRTTFSFCNIGQGLPPRSRSQSSAFSHEGLGASASRLTSFSLLSLWSRSVLLLTCHPLSLWAAFASVFDNLCSQVIQRWF